MSYNSATKGQNFGLPVLYAALIHALVAGMLFFSWGFTDTTPKVFEIPESIKATVVALEKPAPAAVKPKTQPKPQVKPKPQAKPQAKPKPTEIPKVTPKEVPKAAPVKVPEVVTEPAPEIPVVVEPVITAVQETPEPVVSEVSQEDLFQELLAGIEAEELDITEQLDDIAATEINNQIVQAQIADYIVSITRQIEQQWSRPAELRLLDLSAVEAIVLVELLPTGELQRRELTKSSGIPNYDQSVLRAIEKVHRFNVPKNSEVFEAGGFRRLHLTFRPEDL